MKQDQKKQEEVDKLKKLANNKNLSDEIKASVKEKIKNLNQPFNK